jgi:type IV pilus assembly protein PilV
MNAHRNSRHSRQAGVGLIEVLVAVLVLSIGLLGLAGLQMRTLRNSQSSLERGVAVVETHAVADAMRADRINATNGLFDIALGAADPGGTTFADVVLAGWRENLRNSLGEEADGAVDCNGALCRIDVRWNDSLASGGITTQTLTTWVQL